MHPTRPASLPLAADASRDPAAPAAMTPVVPARAAQDPPLDGPRLFPLREVALRLGVSRRTVQALVAAGALAVVRVSPRRIGVAEADLATFVAARREGGR